MKTIQKLVLCFGLLTILSAPLAGCSGTWHGVKEDWHDVTSSNDSPSDAAPATATADASAATTSAQVEPAAQAAPQDTTTLRSETTTTTTYNR